MNKKKTKKTIRPTGKLREFWKTQRCRRLRGATYMLFALFMAASMASFFVAWPSHENWLGTLGYGVARLLVQGTFGVASFGLAFLLFLLGLRMLGKEPLPWWKTFWSSLFWMVWLSTLLGYCAGVWGKGDDVLGNFAGVTGDYLAQFLHRAINWGTLVLLAFLGGVVLVFVHRMKVPKPHLSLPKVSLPKFKSLKEAAPLAAEEDGGAAAGTHKSEDQEPPEEDAIEEEEEPLVKESFRPKPQKGASIDDEFVRVNQRAQQGEYAAPTFTINGNDSLEESEPAEAEPLPGGAEADPCGAEPEPTEADVPETGSLDSLYDPHLDLKQYEMPETSLLTDWETRNTKVTKEELVSNKDRIVETLHNYGIEITEINASPGPTVTLYEIKPAPGIRISKIKSLEDDIALSLSALGIRIIAPIPGRGTVGIEVPNTKPQIVSMKNMLDCDAFRNSGKMELPVAFGKTISNEPFITDLAKMPHLLMAGATGTGKSVGLNAVIASLLFKKHPSELKFVMVDPKKVELSLYNKIERHYLAKLPDSEDAIITDVRKVVRTLNSLCIEMDNRYDLLRQAGVRKITEYNDKFIHRHLNPLTEVTPGNSHRYLPYIVLVIDEFADLIMTAGKEVEMPICRLAQLARAVGIHLIIATQRPTTNIITGTIKANFPARVAFKVTSGIDSRTILDCGGAQRLIGRGDMLISLSGSDLIRIQCALIETEEIEELADYIGQQRGYPDGFLLPEYLDENEEPNKEFDPKQKDEFFNDAARLVVTSQFGSTSLLQRKLGLGYNRAGRIIDQLEAAGIVGPYNGSKARDVLIHDEATLEEILREL